MGDYESGEQRRWKHPVRRAGAEVIPKQSLSQLSPKKAGPSFDASFSSSHLSPWLPWLLRGLGS